jgi:phospholipase/carboxylesterase
MTEQDVPDPDKPVEPKPEDPFMPIAIAHGTLDPVISVDWGRRARAQLEAAGADVVYHESPIPHTIDPAFVKELRTWIVDTLDVAEG